MRISDWSSDVCSSDLRTGRGNGDSPSLEMIVPRRSIPSPDLARRCVEICKSRRWISRISIQREERAALQDRVDLKRNHAHPVLNRRPSRRSEEHTSELQSLMRISYAVFCLKNKKQQKH